MNATYYPKLNLLRLTTYVYLINTTHQIANGFQIEKRAILQTIEESLPILEYSKPGKITQPPQRTKIGDRSHNEMTCDFKFHQLAGPNQIARHLDVRVAWQRVARGVIVGEHD